MDQYDQYDSSSSSYHSDSGEGGGGSSSYIRLSSRLLSNLTSSLLTSEPTIVSQVLAANVAAAAAASTASGHTLNMLNDTPLSTTTTTTSGGSGTFGTGSGVNGTNSNSSGGGSGGYVPYEARPETYIVPLIFLLIFVLGTIGNGTVIYIFYQHKSMRTVANVYILSLAAGDLALIFISVPFVSTIYTFESWPYGLLVCKISEFARDLSIGVTVFTLTTLSVQRYTATHHPIRYLSHKGRNTLTQANTFIWLLSILLAAPGAYNSYMLEFQVEPGHKVKVCYPFPEHLGPWYSKVMVLTKFLAYYVIPLVVISVFYTLMARSLIRTTENPVGTNESQHKLLRNRKKISKIVLGLVVIFAICFFPNQVIGPGLVKVLFKGNVWSVQFIF